MPKIEVLQISKIYFCKILRVHLSDRLRKSFVSNLLYSAFWTTLINAESS